MDQLHAQRLVHDCLVEIAARLEPGVTEREAARTLHDALVGRGATAWFHEPYVWFGDHTAPRTPRRSKAFTPTDRRLEPGMVAILDAAPQFADVVIDHSYTFACGDAPPELAQLFADLAVVRALVVDAARSACGAREIFRAVDALAAERGCRTCHQLVPLGPLAHRVDRVRAPRLRAKVAGVDLGMLFALGGGELVARGAAAIGAEVASPLWTAHGSSARRQLVGVWSVEPHLARGDIGAKFEELLVVTDSDAAWLDELHP